MKTKIPTNGWLISELEKHGVRVRGTALATKPAEMVKQLKVLGYNVALKEDKTASEDR